MSIKPEKKHYFLIHNNLARYILHNCKIYRTFAPMKVSIITVAYNSEKTIADAIKSVLAQTYLVFTE